MFVDVHIHLDLYDEVAGKASGSAVDLDALLERARDAGVSVIITQGTSAESNEKALALAAKYGPLVKAALGLYPTVAKEVEADLGPDEHKTAFSVDETIERIKKAFKEHPEVVVALGEVGMDGKYSVDFEHQALVFRKFVRLAKELKKPLIIHTRKAEQNIIDILEEEEIDPRLVVLHCFSGKRKLIERAANLKYSFSVPALVVRSEQFQELVKMVPISQLLTETDGPYLAPDRALPYSEPAHVVDSVKIIAELKGMDAEEAKKNIFMNYQRIF